MEEGTLAQRAIQRIPLQARMQAVRVERIGTEWRIWLSHDAECSTGTYIALHDDTSMERVVVYPDGGEDRFVIREKE